MTCPAWVVVMDFRLPPQFIQRHTEARRRAVNPSVRSSAHLRPRQKTLILRTPFDRPVQFQQPLSGETARSVCRRGVRFAPWEVGHCVNATSRAVWLMKWLVVGQLPTRATVSFLPALFLASKIDQRRSPATVVRTVLRRRRRRLRRTEQRTRRAAMTTPSHGCFIFSAPSVRGTWQPLQLQSARGYGRQSVCGDVWLEYSGTWRRIIYEFIPHTTVTSLRRTVQKAACVLGQEIDGLGGFGITYGFPDSGTEQEA